MLENDVASLVQCYALPLDMRNLRRIFTLLMRCHFENAANYGDYQQDLSCLVYSEDPAKSTLLVESVGVFDPTKAGPRPAVYVGFAAVQLLKKVIDNFAGESDDGSTTRYAAMSQTTLVLSCVSPSADTALLLAESAMAFLIGMRTHIMGNLQLSQFDPTQLSQPVEYQAAPEKFYKVDLTFNMAFNLVIAANIEGHRLKKVSMQINPA